MKSKTLIHLFLFVLVAFAAQACTINVPSAGGPTPQPGASQTPAQPAAAPVAQAPQTQPQPAAPSRPKSSIKSTVSSSAAPDPCARDEEIKFKPGTSEVTLKREICANMEKEYWFKASAGQVLSMSLSDDSGRLEFYDDQRNFLPVTTMTNLTIPSNGTFVFYVKNTDLNMTQPYRVYLKIR
ncbi:MAG: hypothetical protein R2684_17335 [Pyrinomonadaceae bacterium]